MPSETIGNASFRIGKSELKKISKVLAWSFGSAFVVFLLGVVEAVEVPAQFEFLVPLANTILYSLKEWIADNRI